MKECFLCKKAITDNKVLCDSCNKTFKKASEEDINEISSIIDLRELLERKKI